MKDAAVFSSELVTVFVVHGEVFCYDHENDTFSLYDEDEKKQSLWLDAAAGAFKVSRSWKRVL